MWGPLPPLATTALLLPTNVQGGGPSPPIADGGERQPAGSGHPRGLRIWTKVKLPAS